MRPTMSVADLRAHTTLLAPGSHVNERQLLTQWIGWGYESVPVVEQPGQLSRRGGIIDVFPPSADAPVRIELFGDEVESLRRFDPMTQRSQGPVARVAVIPPAELPPWRAADAREALRELDLTGLRPEIIAEWQRTTDTLARGEMPPLGDGPLAPYFLPEMHTLIDALPPDALVIVDEPGAVRLAVNQLAAQAEELRDQFIAGGELPRNVRVPYLGWDGVRERLARHPRLELGQWEETSGVESETFTADVLGFRPGAELWRAAR